MHILDKKFVTDNMDLSNVNVTDCRISENVLGYADTHIRSRTSTMRH